MGHSQVDDVLSHSKFWAGHEGMLFPYNFRNFIFLTHYGQFLFDFPKSSESCMTYSHKPFNPEAPLSSGKSRLLHLFSAAPFQRIIFLPSSLLFKDLQDNRLTGCLRSLLIVASLPWQFRSTFLQTCTKGFGTTFHHLQGRRMSSTQSE